MAGKGKATSTSFKPGQSGNPAGRKKGSRNKLGEAFLSDLYNDWLEHGVQVIAAVRENRPQDYLKITASILPKQIQLDNRSDLTDEELNARIRQLSAVAGIELLPRPVTAAAPTKARH